MVVLSTFDRTSLEEV